METSFSARPSDEDLDLLWPKTPYNCLIGGDFVLPCRCELCSAHRRSRWDEEEEMYFMNIDLAAGCVEVGHVLDNFDDTSIDEQLFSNETVH